MENQLQKLIISAQLTPKEKEVADYVLENLQKCCFMTSTELAGVLNVSYSSRDPGLPRHWALPGIRTFRIF